MNDVVIILHNSVEIFLEQFEIVLELLIFNNKLLLALILREIFGSLVATKIIDRFVFSKVVVMLKFCLRNDLLSSKFIEKVVNTIENEGVFNLER